MYPLETELLRLSLDVNLLGRPGWVMLCTESARNFDDNRNNDGIDNVVVRVHD